MREGEPFWEVIAETRSGEQDRGSRRLKQERRKSISVTWSQRELVLPACLWSVRKYRSGKQRGPLSTSSHFPGQGCSVGWYPRLIPVEGFSVRESPGQNVRNREIQLK